MAVKIRLRRVLLPENGNLIVPGNDLLPIGIVHGGILCKAVAGISHREMRACLLRNEDGQAAAYPEAARHGVGSRIGANGKFSQGQRAMPSENHLLHQLPALGLGIRAGSRPSGSPICIHRGYAGRILIFLEIPAGILCGPSLPECNPQILKQIFPDIDLLHMQKPLCARKHRGGEHLPQGDIHIRHAVLKIRLPLPVCKGMEGHPQSRLISLPPGNGHIGGPIQGVNDALLYFLIFLVIQGVDFDGLPENLLEVRPYLRPREGNNGKAGLVPRHILVDNPPYLPGAAKLCLLLVGGEGQGCLLVDRLEARLPKALRHRRACAPGGLLLKGLIGRAGHGKLPLPKAISHINRTVIAVVVLILPVGGAAEIPPLSAHTPVHRLHSRPVDDGRKSHVPEIFYGTPHHALKAQGILQDHGPFLPQVPAHHLKAPAKPFRIGVRHPVNLLLGQPPHKGRKLQVRIRHKLPVLEEIPGVLQI